uniref:Fe2OG dioxygenase domain-containing protein n=1 Tax=Calcidiscus leptoporus TaxID=127549 RepID=A0A7S0JIS4_9EUKA|mmetsp:Transcript_59195/g.135790  ORF Transcript_59195/g.135790 Transcript_59195/m.135790 type:complete len:622 (+) Transcript_59195:3-1868(+)
MAQRLLLAMAACTTLPLLAAAAYDRLPFDLDGPISLPDDPALLRELQRNVDEHDEASRAICAQFFCGGVRTAAPFEYDTYAVGMPSVDYPEALHDSGAHIHVSRAPLFPAAEMNRVVELAEAEGIATRGDPTQAARASMKYGGEGGQVAIGTKIELLPSVLAWFNGACEHVLFPQMAALFPRLITDGSKLRAHTIAVLKYNTTHPRTDVHVDPSLFAFTIALSPRGAYEGGGTFFEHIDTVVDMEQGHVTFRPGAVRHAGAPISSGLRYVIGGFIALDDRIEHVRRLNERGNKMVVHNGPETTVATLERATALFQSALDLNAQCPTCHENLADVYLRLDQNQEAEAALRRHLALLPKDSDGHYSLGLALRSQEREAEAVQAYRTALELEPNDFACTLSLAGAHGALGEYEEERRHYLRAVALKPDSVKALLNLGISHSSFGESESAEAAFRNAMAADPSDARPPLNLARYLVKLARPAEAITNFYVAAAANAEYFGEVKLGVGTAQAQQGRLAEAVQSFESAHRLDQKNEKLSASLASMRTGAEKLDALQSALTNGVADVCGTPCQQVVDAGSVAMCALTWADGCGDVTPPQGFSHVSTVAQLCAHACAYSTMVGERGGEG